MNSTAACFHTSCTFINCTPKQPITFTLKVQVKSRNMWLDAHTRLQLFEQLQMDHKHPLHTRTHTLSGTPRYSIHPGFSLLVSLLTSVRREHRRRWIESYYAGSVHLAMYKSSHIIMSNCYVVLIVGIHYY